MGTPASALFQKHRAWNVERRAYGTGNDPNSNLIFDVPRGGYIATQIVTLRGSLVISGGTVNGTSLGENPGNLIQQIAVEANPAGQIKRLLPRSLIRSSIIHLGHLVQPTAALVGAAGTFVISQPYFLHYKLPRNVRGPMDSALQTDRFASIQVRVQGGGRSTQFSGNDRTWDPSGLTVDLSQQTEFMGGKTALILEDDLVQPITAANPQFTVSAFSLGRRYLFQNYIAETTNQQLADTIINRISVRSGGVVFIDAMEDESKMAMELWLSNDSGVAGNSLVQLTGCYFAPLSPEFTLGGAVNLINASQLITNLDVSNPGTDRLIVHSIACLLPIDLP